MISFSFILRAPCVDGKQRRQLVQLVFHQNGIFVIMKENSPDVNGPSLLTVASMLVQRNVTAQSAENEGQNIAERSVIDDNKSIKTQR